MTVNGPNPSLWRQPASKLQTVPIPEGAKSGNAHAGKEGQRNGGPHRGDNKKRQQKKGKSAQSSGAGLLEGAVREAVDQASGAKIAAADMRSENKELKDENAKLQKVAEEAKKLMDDFDAETRARLEGLRRGFDMKIRWRPTYLPGWRLCFWLLSWVFVLASCLIDLAVGLLVRFEGWLVLHVDVVAPLFGEGLLTFALYGWLLIRTIRGVRWLGPALLARHTRCILVAKFLSGYSRDITPEHICWWEVFARRVVYHGLVNLPVAGDVRPDANRLQEMRHKDPLYATVQVSKRWGVFRSTTMTVSLELVSQLTAPRFVSMGSQSQDLHDRMIRAAETYPFINIDKYSSLSKMFVANDSVRLAKLLLEFERSRPIEDFLQ